MQKVLVQTRYLYERDGKFVPHSKDNKPAIIKADGEKIWMDKGIVHNDNGPAIVRGNGDKVFFLRGEEMSESRWNENRRQPPSNPGNPNIQQVTYKTQKELKNVHGNVSRAHIKGSRGAWFYSP